MNNTIKLIKNIFLLDTIILVKNVCNFFEELIIF